MRVEIPMSRFGYILAAIDECNVVILSEIQGRATATYKGEKETSSRIYVAVDSVQNSH